MRVECRGECVDRITRTLEECTVKGEKFNRDRDARLEWSSREETIANEELWKGDTLTVPYSDGRKC